MFDLSPRVEALRQQALDFMDEHVYPNERRYYDEAEQLGPWAVYPVVEELKPKARAAACGTCSCRHRTKGASATWNTHPYVK